MERFIQLKIQHKRAKFIILRYNEYYLLLFSKHMVVITLPFVENSVYASLT